MTFLEQVCRALEAQGVHYAVVGGYAVALHGAVRGTVDVDVVVRFTLEEVTAAEAALKALGLASRLPVTAAEIFHFRDEYIERRDLVAWNFYDPEDASKQVDLVIAYDLAGRRRQRVKLPATEIYVLSRGDLIEMKRESGRRQDLEDVAALERLP